MNVPFAPRLMDETTARAYLDGVDPRRVAEPLCLGRAVRWDRNLLDAVLDKQSGLEKPEREGTAYEERQRRKARARNGGKT
jgi:hypothetical protein